MSEVESYHPEFDVLIRVPSTQAEAAQEIELARLVASVAPPDRVKAKLSSLSLFASEEGDRTEVEIVTIGETTYTTDPDTKEWQARPSTEEDFEFTLASAIVKSMTDAIKLDDDEVDGVVSYQLKGNVRPDALGPTQDLPGPDQGTAPESINAEIWISKNDFFVRQYRVEDEFPGAEVAGTMFISTIKLSKFNEPVIIEAPTVVATPTPTGPTTVPLRTPRGPRVLPTPTARPGATPAACLVDQGAPSDVGVDQSNGAPGVITASTKIAPEDGVGQSFVPEKSLLVAVAVEITRGSRGVGADTITMKIIGEGEEILVSSSIHVCVGIAQIKLIPPTM